jgi:hypothetical protein
MRDNKGTNGINSGRIAALKERERQIRAAIAAETVKRRKREFKELEKLKTVIGGALLATAADDQVFALHLKERLQKAAIVESDKTFLRSKGWL